jgi:sulfopyruvate decarboxylase TPP-binding subunit
MAPEEMETVFVPEREIVMVKVLNLDREMELATVAALATKKVTVLVQALGMVVAMAAVARLALETARNLIMVMAFRTVASGIMAMDLVMAPVEVPESAMEVVQVSSLYYTV